MCESWVEDNVDLTTCAERGRGRGRGGVKAGQNIKKSTCVNGYVSDGSQDDKWKDFAASLLVTTTACDDAKRANTPLP